MPESILMQYTGNKSVFRDHLFGTRLTWKQGETHAVSLSVVERMEKFPGDFTRVGVSVEEAEEEATEPEATALPLPVANVAIMEKERLIEYAATEFGVRLDARKSRENLMNDVQHLVQGTM